MTDFSRILLSYRDGANAPVAISTRFLTFPGGEQHVWLGSDVAGEGRAYLIDARIYSSMAVMNLLLVNDALRRIVGSRAVVELILPYLPYARQDRVTTAGEPLSITVFCALINSMKLDGVLICDPHSPVGPALLDNVQVMDVGNYVQQAIEPVGKGRNIALVAPDAGSHKRVEALGQATGLPVVFCGKTRDSKTGRLSNPYVEGKVPDVPLLVVDDICDGGGTFAALAPVLRQYTDQPISLYVTHGLLTRGLAPLKDYARIFTAFPRDGAAWSPSGGIFCADPAQAAGITPPTLCSSKS
jgi:ribose-phosphate pyrophosphokinase